MSGDTRQRNYFFKKISLPSALQEALGKEINFLKKKFFAECPSRRLSAKKIIFFKKTSLPSDRNRPIYLFFTFYHEK
jgi:hypothetical protein